MQRSFQPVMTSIVLTAAMLLAAGQAFGSVIGYSITSSDDLVTVDLMTGTTTTIGTLGVDGDYEGLAFSPLGTLFAFEDNGQDLYTINITTGAATLVGNSGVDVSNSGLSFRSDGTLFLTVDGGVEGLYTLNTSTGAATLVGNYPSDPRISAIAFRNDGTLFGINPEDDELVTINTSTGALTTVAPLSIILGEGSQQGLDFDASGTLYLMSESLDGVYTVDTGTGLLTLSVSLPDGTESFAIPKTVIPEPSSLALSGFGVLMLAGYGWRRRRKTLLNH